MFAVFLPIFFTIFLHFIVQKVLLLKNLFPKSDQFRLIVVSFVVDICYISYLIYVDNNFFFIIYAITSTIFLQYSYFHFFNMSLTARRINMLIEIYNNTYTMKHTYSPEVMIRNRLNRLVQLNQIKINNNKITLISYKFLLIGIFLKYLGILMMGKNKRE
jgi:hypothetical protein